MVFLSFFLMFCIALEYGVILKLRFDIKDLQKEILQKICEDLGLDKKLVRRMAKVYYRANFNDEMEENRSKVLEEVMRGVPEDDEDIEDEDEEDDDLDYEDDENGPLVAA